MSAPRPVDEALPSHGRLAGIDFGTVRIGIAMTDPDRILASPWETYHRKNLTLDGQYFQRLAREERVVGWVLGWPIHLDGNESAKSREVTAFAVWLKALTNLPIALQDERFSTAFAREALGGAQMTRKKSKARVDRVAAQILLSAYLESHRAVTGEMPDQPAGPGEFQGPGGIDD